MAKLPDETFSTIFSLQRRLLERINEATATDAAIFEQFGEVEETRPELEELQSIRERSTSAYTRLYTLLLRVAEAQPVASSATLNLLEQSIEQTQAYVDSAAASIMDVKRNWNLL